MELTDYAQVTSIDIQKMSPPEPGNEYIGRYIPCKPLYFQTIDVQQVCDSRKEGICENRELKSLKSLSKGLKKKRHKNKKFEKTLWDPSIQIPDLGNLTKYLKKKKKIAGIKEAKEHRIPSNQDRNIGKSDLSRDCLQMYRHKLSEPEHTFDIIFANESYLGKVPQSFKESSVDDFARSTTPQEFMPASHENNTLLVGDLIDLGTPETFRPKVINNDKEPPAVVKMDEMGEIVYFPPDLSSLEELSSVLSIDLLEPAPSNNTVTPIKDDSELTIIDQRKQECPENPLSVVENPSSGVEEISHSDQAAIFKIRGESSNQIKRVNSPQLFYGFPGLINSSEEEKQHLFLGENPIEMLVSRLENDPFPQHGRKNAKVIVKRRAFSMDDAMMECWRSKSLNDLGGVSCPSGSPNIVAADQAYSTSRVECLTNNLVQPLENDPPCDSTSVAQNKGMNQITDNEKTCEPSLTTSHSAGNLTNSITRDTSAPQRHDVVDGAMVPDFEGTPRVDNNCPSLLRESGTYYGVTDVSDFNNTNDNLKCVVNKPLSELPLHGESFTKAHENTKNEDQTLVQASSIEHENACQIAEVQSGNSSASNSLIMENLVCGVIEKTHSLRIENVNGEPEDNVDSSLQLLVSSDSDIMTINDARKSIGTLTELHDSITEDEKEACITIDCPPSLLTSSQNLCEEYDVRNWLDLDIPVLPLTKSESPYSLDTCSAGDNLSDIGVFRLDSNSQKTSDVVQVVAEEPSDISVQSLLKNRLTLDTTSICTPRSCDEIEECLKEISECSSDETNISNRNSTSVTPVKSEKSYESDRIGMLRNKIQDDPPGPQKIDLCTGSIQTSISGDEFEQCRDTNAEMEECSVDVTYYVSDHNSTYVVDSGHSEEPHNSDPVDVMPRETILGNSTDPPQGNLSADTTHTTGDESEKCEINAVEIEEDRTDTTFDDYGNDSDFGGESCVTPLQHWVLPAGKKFRRSLTIIRNLDEHHFTTVQRGRHYEKSVEEIIKLQGNNEDGTPIQSLRKRLSLRRSSWFRQMTPPPVRRNTFIWSPSIPERGTLYETPHPRRSVYLTPMQQNVVRRASVRSSPLVAPRRSIRTSFTQNCSPESPAQYTIRDLILTICKQNEPCCFYDILNENAFKGGCKLGEGVFGEVFSINRGSEYTVLKIIPIEGQDLINGEKQKTYSEVLSELIIAKVLHELRYEGSDESNLTAGYAELISTSLVQGSYPETLLEFWKEFDQSKGSDNDNPKIFGEDQLFIVMEQGNGGKDLESYAFSSAKQSLSIFKQIAFSLAVAEISVEFEHRDLHWGNVLVSKTSEKQIYFHLNGSRYSVASSGVKSTIIDYTLSRIKYVNQFPIYNDIGKDPEMFIATGDYQFDVYRLMKKDVDDDWSRFAPKTNARWLHYLLDKILTKVKYQRKTAKVHKDSLRVLEEIGSWIEECGSALSVALRVADMKN